MNKEITAHFQTRHVRIKDANPSAPLKGIIVEAHIDDIAMAKVTRELTKVGTELLVVSLTDGAARGLVGYTPEVLPDVRWNEGIHAARLAGVTERFGIELPDGKLTDHQDAAITFLKEIQRDNQGDFMIAPNLFDEHPDHAAAHEIALAAAGKEIPVYGMDTISGGDMYGRPLHPDRYLTLSGRTARRENRIYLAHTSQVTNLPPDEIKATKAVLNMTRRRGLEIGVPNAGVLFDPLNTTKNPLSEIMVFQKR